MQRLSKTLIVFLTLTLLSLTSITYGFTADSWYDDFTENSIQTSGGLSADYWYRSSYDSACSHIISDGWLHLYHQTSDNNTHATCIERQAITSGDKARWEFKIKCNTALDSRDNYFIQMPYDATHQIAQILIQSSGIKFGYRNETNIHVDVTLTTSVTAGEEHTFIITLYANRTLALNFDNSTSTYTSYYTTTDISEVRIYSEIMSSASATTVDSELSIDYVYWNYTPATPSDINDIVNAWVPAIVTFAMLGVVLSMMKRFMQ